MSKPKKDEMTLVPVSLLLRATRVIKEQQVLLQELVRKLESKNA